jgi:hypothetical protein
LFAIFHHERAGRAARAGRRPNPERIAWYHAVAVRNGRPLGITSGNYCASAQSRALLECVLPGDAKPHEARAAAIELQADAMRVGRWHPIAEVRGGKWRPRSGDLAVYDRSNPAEPSTGWQRHVDRVIQLSADGAHCENIGANEVAGGLVPRVDALRAPPLARFHRLPSTAAVRSRRQGARAVDEQT